MKLSIQFSLHAFCLFQFATQFCHSILQRNFKAHILSQIALTQILHFCLMFSCLGPGLLLKLPVAIKICMAFRNSYCSLVLACIELNKFTRKVRVGPPCVRAAALWMVVSWRPRFESNLIWWILKSRSMLYPFKGYL